MQNFESELQKYLSFENEMESRFPSFRRYADFAFSYQENTGGNTDQIHFWISGLIHGDEVVGLAVINQILEMILSHQLQTPLSLGFSLGNVEAGHSKIRFVERDLNRSFAITDVATAEARRAQELSQMAIKSQALLDLHQTTAPSLSAFYIFPHTLENFRFMKLLNTAEYPLVSFSDEGFSADGKTLMEHLLVLAKTQSTTASRISIGVELGQKGFSEPQQKIGVDLVLKMIQLLERPQALGSELGEDMTYYRIIDKINFGPELSLVAGLANLMDVKKGQILAESSKGNLPAPRDGKIFFPKYTHLTKRGTDLVEIAVPEKVRV